MICRNISSSRSRRRSSAWRRPLSWAWRNCLSRSASLTMARMRRSCWKRRNSFESWSSVWEMMLPWMDSRTPSKALSLSWSMYRFSSTVVAVSAYRSAARSSLMRSSLFSLPSNMMFWKARPRMMRCNNKTAASCSSSSGSTSSLRRGESGRSNIFWTWNFLRPALVVACSPVLAASPSAGCCNSFLIPSMEALSACAISNSFRIVWLDFAFLPMSLGCLSMGRKSDGGNDASKCIRPGYVVRSAGCTSILAVFESGMCPSLASGA
mmetsp:Transcript_104967/g.321569  ORF Transcript_104967/g.321569 Transcript_104967/m.321569 type:complete len:266 (-) Transcript_104967:1101-1898(-)